MLLTGISASSGVWKFLSCKSMNTLCIIYVIVARFGAIIGESLLWCLKDKTIKHPDAALYIFTHLNKRRRFRSDFANILLILVVCT